MNTASSGKSAVIASDCEAIQPIKKMLKQVQHDKKGNSPLQGRGCPQGQERGSQEEIKQSRTLSYFSKFTTFIKKSFSLPRREVCAAVSCHSESSEESKKSLPQSLGGDIEGESLYAIALHKAPHPAPPRSRGGNRAAFTLAEVLITIGIIGIVAALTIPTLIKNYQKKAWVNELKVAYATINQAFKLAEADDQVTDLAGTTLYQTCKGVLNTSPQSDIDACITEWRKYVKIIGVDPKPTSNYCTEVLGKYSWKCGPDGKCSGGYGCAGSTTYLSVHLLNSTHMVLNLKDDWNNGNIHIDINGPKGPNTWGRDAFAFQIAKDGHLYAFGSKEHLRYSAQSQGIDPEEYIQQRHWSNVDVCTKGKIATQSNGQYCTGRVVEEGWVMNY